MLTRHPPNSIAWRSLLAPSLALLLACASAGADEVTITGGRIPEATAFRWTLTNNGASLIVDIEFPVFRIHKFDAPPGWQRRATGMIGTPGDDQPGTCRLWVEPGAAGLAPGASITFEAGVPRETTNLGLGEVTVKFADGRSVRVAGVELPVRPGFVSRNFMMFGMGGILILAIALGRRRRRRAEAPQAAE